MLALINKYTYITHANSSHTTSINWKLVYLPKKSFPIFVKGWKWAIKINNTQILAMPLHLFTIIIQWASLANGSLFTGNSSSPCPSLHPSPLHSSHPLPSLVLLPPSWRSITFQWSLSSSWRSVQQSLDSSIDPMWEFQSQSCWFICPW